MDDPARPLIPEGRQKLRSLLKLAQRAHLEPTEIWTSPYLRCLQTAEEVQKVYKIPIVPKRELEPEAHLEHVQDGIWIVGHEPDLSQLAARLFQTQIAFKKAALAGFQNGRLEFLLTPKWAKGV